MANADPQSKSFSHWDVSPKTVTAVFTILHRDLAVLQNYETTYTADQRWLAHLSGKARLSTATACELIDSKVVASSKAYSRSRLEWRCKEPLIDQSALNVRLDLLFEQVPGHLHFANFQLPGNERAEKLFNQSQRTLLLQLGEAKPGVNNHPGPVFTSYVRFGFEHILAGLDHIAFLLALLLLGGSWRQTLLVVTGFTLGHSITLSLSTLGLVSPNIGFTEALIGLSIALVAIENVAVRSQKSLLSAHTVGAAILALAIYNLCKSTSIPTVAILGLSLFSWCYLQLSHSQSRAHRLRPIITALFGLIHGFGFASVLMEVGLPDGSRPIALLGFNVEVELGQILIVGILLGAGAVFRGLIDVRDRLATDLLSALLCTLGVYWFVQRLYF